MEFSLRKMKEVLKSVGDKRVSDPAAEELNDLLEDFGGEIAEDAVSIASEKGRKTVRAEDIRDALRERRDYKAETPDKKHLQRLKA